MKLTPSNEIALAELLDRFDGTTQHNCRLAARVPADVAELAELAQQIRGLPPVQPAASWLHSSKQRLLRRFDDVKRHQP